MATTAGSVGAGMPKPMVVSAEEDLANEFYYRHGHSGSTGLVSAFADFIRARGLKLEDAQALQGKLVSEYGMFGLASRLDYLF